MNNKLLFAAGVLFCLGVTITVYWLKANRPLSEGVIVKVIEESENYDDLATRIQNKIPRKVWLGNYISELSVLGENRSEEGSSVDFRKYEGTIISGNKKINAIPRYGCEVYSFIDLGPFGGSVAKSHYVVFDKDKRLIGIVVRK